MKDKTVKKSGKGLRIVFVLIMAVLLGIIGFCVYNIIIIQNLYLPGFYQLLIQNSCSENRGSRFR